VITAVATAKKMGWDVNFLGSSAAFHTAVAKVPGGVTNNFYAAAGWQDLETQMDVPEVQEFIESYTAAYGVGEGDHLGADPVIISQIVDGSWKTLVSELPE